MVVFLQSKGRKRGRTYVNCDYPIKVGEYEKETDSVREEIA